LKNSEKEKANKPVLEEPKLVKGKKIKNTTGKRRVELGKVFYVHHYF
jgi:hypothetical protein